MNQRPVGEDGFTLVEVLVAFTILAVTIIAAFQILGTGAAHIAASAKHRELAATATAALAEIRLRYDAGARDLAPTDGGDGPWHITVTPVDAAPAGAFELEPVFVTLSPRGQGDDQPGAPAQTTILLRPRAR